MEQCPSGPHQVQQDCSQHLDMAQQFPLCTGHWTELPTPAQGPRVALPSPWEGGIQHRGWQEPSRQRAFHARQLPGLPEQAG